MSEVMERDAVVIDRYVEVNGRRTFVQESGQGDTVAILYGYGGVPRFPPFAARLAKTHRVLVLSLPGQQGSDRGHDDLHTPLDWITATLDLIEGAAGAGVKVDLVAQSVAGMLGGEIAAVAPTWLRSLTLVGPLGLYDVDDPTQNLYAQSPPLRLKMMTERPDLFSAAFGADAGASAAEQHEHEVISYRAEEAAARLMWPFGDMGLKRRLHRVRVPVLLIWGSEDKLIPQSYAQRFATALHVSSRIEVVPGAGHLATIDAPDECANLVEAFVGETAHQVSPPSVQH